MIWKKILFEVLKTAPMVAKHNGSAGFESTIPSLMPNLATALFKYADGFLSFKQFRTVTLPHSVFQTYTWPNLSILIGIIPHNSTLKHYFVEK